MAALIPLSGNPTCWHAQTAGETRTHNPRLAQRVGNFVLCALALSAGALENGGARAGSVNGNPLAVPNRICWPYLSPGYITDVLGTGLCYLNERDPSGQMWDPMKCGSATMQIKEALSGEQKAVIFENPPNDEYGWPLETSLGKFRLHVTPEKLENKQKAVAYIQENILKSGAEIPNAQEILRHVSNLHELLIGRKVSNRSLPEYRTADMVINKFDDIVDQRRVSEEDVRKALRSIGQEQQYDAFLRYHDHFFGNGKNRILADNLATAEERKAFRLIFSFPLTHTKIPEQMKRFSEELAQKLQGMLTQNEGDKPNHVLEIAAWAHQEFVRIHPFGQANGREARSILDLILELGGKNPAVFADAKEYNRIVAKDIEDGGKDRLFERHLHEAVEFGREHVFGDQALEGECKEAVAFSDLMKRFDQRK